MQFKRYMNHSMCFDMYNDPKHVEEMKITKRIKWRLRTKIDKTNRIRIKTNNKNPSPSLKHKKQSFLF